MVCSDYKAMNELKLLKCLNRAESQPSGLDQSDYEYAILLMHWKTQEID